MPCVVTRAMTSPTERTVGDSSSREALRALVLIRVVGLVIPVASGGPS